MKKKRRLQRSDLFWLLAATLLVLLQFWWLPGNPGTPDDTYSNTIEGKRGFFETLKSLAGVQMLPEVRRESEKLIPDDVCTLLVLSPDRYPNETEQKELTNFVRNGGNLMFAPNWENPDVSIAAIHIQTEKTHFENQNTVVSQPATSPNPPGDLPSQTELPTDAGAGPNSVVQESSGKGTASGSSNNRPANNPADRSRDTPTPKKVRDVLRTQPGMQPTPYKNSANEHDHPTDVANLDTESPLIEGPVVWRTRAKMETGDMRPVVLVETADGTVQAATWSYGNGRVLLSASADIFSNKAMLNSQQAELAVRLVERLHSDHHHVDSTPIVVSEFLNVSESYRSTGVLMSPSLRSGTLQMLLVGLLAGWFGFHRFGPARRNTSFERRSLTESATAVGNLFFRTQSGREAVSCYLNYFKTQLQASFGNSVRIDDYNTIARRTELDPDEVRERIARAISCSNSGATTTSAAASAIRDLSEIMNRLSGGREPMAEFSG